jgi:hypothetical protein
MFLFTGGYIGLFLGYALLQIPDLCFKLIEWMKKSFSRIYKDRNNDDQENIKNSPDDVGTGVGHVDCLET